MESTLTAQTIWRRCWALLGLLIMLVAPASAQRGDDDGDYRILQARYGTAERNIDVTQRLKELAREDRRFKLGNDTWGTDPDPGRVKTLRIYARSKNGQTRTFEYTEGSYVDGSQFTGWRGGDWGHEGGWSGGWGGGGHHGGNAEGDDGEFHILQASYGTARRNIDVTQRLKELARQDRSFRMGNDTWGSDPDPGRVKTLRIYARDKRGQTRTFEYTEGSRVDGSQFSGWGGGNWGHGGWGGGWGDGGSNAGNGAYGRLSIVSASYGAGRQTRDVSSRLRGYIRDDRINVKVTNSMAGGDPAPETPKTLKVSYRIGNGRTQEVRVAENEYLRLP